MEKGKCLLLCHKAELTIPGLPLHWTVGGRESESQRQMSRYEAALWCTGGRPLERPPRISDPEDERPAPDLQICRAGQQASLPVHMTPGWQVGFGSWATEPWKPLYCGLIIPGSVLGKKLARGPEHPREWPLKAIPFHLPHTQARSHQFQVPPETVPQGLPTAHQGSCWPHHTTGLLKARDQLK